MKNVIKTTVILASLVFASCTNQSSENQKTVNFKVYGNCGMCEKTIEKSLKIDEVSKGDWNKETKMIEVKFDSTKITTQEIKEKIAGVGYDMDDVRAEESVYNSLHSCCQYQRPE